MVYQQEPLNRSQQLPAPYKRLIHNMAEQRTITLLRMTVAEAVETHVGTTTNSLSQDYTNQDDHISQTSIHSIHYVVWCIFTITDTAVS